MRPVDEPRRPLKEFALLLWIPRTQGNLAPPGHTNGNLVLGKINCVNSSRPIDISYRRDHKKDEPPCILQPTVARQRSSERTANQFKTRGLVGIVALPGIQAQLMIGEP
jgi:hypothetical protein